MRVAESGNGRSRMEGVENNRDGQKWQFDSASDC